ncbi:MAG: hypothetical protein A2Z34_07485 [Planctomycetes bacterium RBG_16_59_8]|nr:MAG: hypothetical protein A2Z34_07485 [Planctomycetes bacterium RBG_16_59_8]
MKTLIFLSDVHLTPADDRKFAFFDRFLRSLDRAEHEVYLLGDIFDYWIGAGHLELGEFDRVIRLFRQATRSGLSIAMIAGNRDYLICRRFEEATGIRFLGREAEVSIGGRRALLTHGDFLFNRNSRYLFYRACMESPPIRGTLTSLPPWAAKRVAGLFRLFLSEPRTARRRGRAYGQDMEKGTLPSSVLQAFEGGIDLLICGHLHTPLTRRFDHRGVERQLIVLGAWDDIPVYAECRDGVFALKRYSDCVVF